METVKNIQDTGAESENNTAKTPATSASPIVYPAIDKLTIQESEHTVTAGDIPDKDRGDAMKADECGLMEAAASKDERDTSEKNTSLKMAYCVVDDEEGLKQSLEEIQTTTRVDPLIALDCEGENLSRIGKLQLVSVATRSKCFLVDIKLLKSQPFEFGLRDILENPDIKKLMFDCREDSDALFHQFNVKLEGVFDIQLLEIIKQSHGCPEESHGRRRSERHEDVVRVKSLLECIELYTKNKKLIQAKRSNAGKLSDWGQRPLQEKQLEYAIADATSLFKMYDKLKPVGDEMKRLEVASDVYINLKRSINSRTFDEFENNGYLPIDVIPPKGKTSFIPGYTNCTKCKRIFPLEEFSKTQIRNGTQMCRTCKQVKQDKDRKDSDRLNYERTRATRSRIDFRRLLEANQPTYYTVRTRQGDEIVWDSRDGILVSYGCDDDDDDGGLGFYFI